MIEETIPAIEVPEEGVADEAAHYECAFHILPTIADEEVPGVVEGLKALVTRSGGTITDEEISERYDLSYEITRQIEGANKRFNAAHFGWIRFTLAPAAVPALTEELKARPEILRYIVIRLTREEAQKPFSIFETRQAHDRAKDALDAEDAAKRKEARGESDGESEMEGDMESEGESEGALETGEVSEEALDESLEKLTTE